MKKLTVISLLMLVLLTSQVMAASQTFQGNITGNAATVTTNANLSGPITSVGNATTIAESNAHAAVTLNQGAEKITNGNFDSGDTAWEKQSGWTIVDQGAGDYKAVATNAIDTSLYQAVTNVATRVYLFTYTITDYVAGSFKSVHAGVFGTEHNADGTYTEIYVSAGTNSNTGIKTVGDSTFKVSSISFKELPAAIFGHLYLTGKTIETVSSYANNAAAVAAGEIVGTHYLITGSDTMGIVHP